MAQKQKFTKTFTSLADLKELTKNPNWNLSEKDKPKAIESLKKLENILNGTTK